MLNLESFTDEALDAVKRGFKLSNIENEYGKVLVCTNSSMSFTIPYPRLHIIHGVKEIEKIPECYKKAGIDFLFMEEIKFLDNIIKFNCGEILNENSSTRYVECTCFPLMLIRLRGAY